MSGRARTPAGVPRVRATVLLAVLLVVAIGAMIGTTVMYFSEAETAGASHAMRAAHGRAAAWSGVQAVMAQLSRQRSDLLSGKAREPDVPAMGVVHSDESGDRRAAGGRRLVFRIVPDRRGGLLRSESAKLDAASATPEMLAKVSGLGSDAASQIVSMRGSGGRLQSTLDLLQAAGLSAEALVGAAAPEPVLRRDPRSATPLVLADLLTVFSFDPEVQAGLDPDGRLASDRTGQPRVQLFGGSEDELRRALDGRVPAEVVDGLLAGRSARASAGGTPTIGDLVRILRGTPPAAWPAVLDSLAPTADEFTVGRVDINRAAAEVLATIPGIDAAAADRMVQSRDRLDDSRRATICWPLLEGVLNGDQFLAASPYLSVRSMQWRVVVEGGWLEPGPAGGRGPIDSDGGESPPLSDAAVLEAVIDIAGPDPRVAYLRDITLKPIAATLARVGIEGRTTPTPEPTSEPSPTAGPPSPPPEDYRPAKPNRADDRRETPAGTPADQSAPTPPTAGPGRIGRWTTGTAAAGGTR